MPLGPVIGGAHVADAADATLRAHLPATVADVAAAHGLELAVPRDPQDYQLVTTADAVRAVDRVMVAVASPGLTAPPRRFGDGTYDARFSLVVSAFARAGDYAGTLRSAWAYAVAVRTVLLQNPTLGGLASGVEWLAEDVAPVGGDASTARTLALAVVEFDVLVPGVADENGEPSTTDTSYQLTSVVTSVQARPTL